MNPIMIRALGHDVEAIDPNVKTCYLFNEGVGEVCKDYSQYGNNGTLKNGAKWTLVSEGGNGIEFDGSDDYIEDREGRHIIREGTSGIWSKVIIGDKTKIVGDGTGFKFYTDYYSGSWHGKKLIGQFIPDFADYCTNLATFYCNANTFSGTLPSFAACTNLATFDCHTNTFSGTLPSFAACTNLATFYCHANTFSGTLPSFAACTNLATFYCNANTFSGTLPSFAACTNLAYFYCNANTFSGTLPSFAACTNLATFYCYTNTFSGTLPSFAACTNLATFSCHANTFSGTLPSFAACTNLAYFYCYANTFSGTLPSFAACTNLATFDCHANTFSGTLPSFAACTNLAYFYCNTNTFSGYESGGFATQPNLVKVYLYNNAITAAADINAILADLRTSYDLPNRVACTVKLEGGTNAAPTGQGITDKTFLNDNGWTVTTN